MLSNVSTFLLFLKATFFLVWQIKPQRFYIFFLLLSFVFGLGCECTYVRRLFLLLFHMFCSCFGWMNTGTVVCSVYFHPSILPSFVDGWNARYLCLRYYATKRLTDRPIFRYEIKKEFECISIWQRMTPNCVDCLFIFRLEKRWEPCLLLAKKGRVKNGFFSISTTAAVYDGISFFFSAAAAAAAAAVQRPRATRIWYKV